MSETLQGALIGTSAALMLLVVPYLAALWLRSRRKRPGQPLYCPVCHSPGNMERLRHERAAPPPSSPPSSEDTETTGATPSGNGGSPRS